MTEPELVDPQLAAFWASDPTILQQHDSADPDAGRREHVRREIAAGIVVIAGLVARELLANRPDDPAQAQVAARSAWSKHAPLWLRLVVPAIRHAYVLGAVDGLSGAELQVMAEDYASTLGDYVDTTSADALADGFHRQLSDHWNERLAWHRAASGYGLDKRQMGSWVKGLMIGSKAGRTDPIPPVAKGLAEKALLMRADRIGADEAYTASQAGRAISWLYLLRAGKLPETARREWDTAEDETVCPLCAPLDAVQVPLDEPFVLPDGTKLWAPRAHPGCHCNVRLVGGEIITKAAEATVAGLCLLAADTGRVLMLQRADDPNDPAGGTWEFPGGHIEDDEVWLGAAKREWAEEVRQHVPDDAKQTGSWQNGIYRGFVMTIPHESEIQTHKRGRVRNPDDPDCDEVEAIAWWDVEHLARNPAVRPELRASLAKVREAIGPISKSFGDDPYNRDAHGEFASTESRKLALRPVLDRDPAIDALLSEIEQGNAAAAPSLLATQPSLLTAPSLLAQPSLLGQKSLLAQESLLTQESLLEQKQKAPARQHLHIQIQLPYAPPPPPGRPSFYMPQDHVQAYLDEAWGGILPNADLDFGEIRESQGERDDYFDDDNEPIFGSDATPLGRIEAHQYENEWDAVPIEAYYAPEEWQRLLSAAAPVWEAALANVDEILDDDRFSDYDMSIVCARAFRGEYHSAAAMKALISGNVHDADDPDKSLAHAFADYVTFVQPDVIPGGGEEFDRYLAVAPDRDILESEPPSLFHFGPELDDDPSDMTGNYRLTGGRYRSVMAEFRDDPSKAPHGRLNAMIVDLEQAERGTGPSPF